MQLTILTCGLVYAVTNFWLCTISDHFRVIRFASLVNFTVCAICCNLDSKITPSTEDFQALTDWDGLYYGVEDKADWKSSWLLELQDKSSQVVNQLSPTMLHENNMIAKTIPDFAFALIKAIPTIITIDCRNSNKKQYSSSEAKIVFTGWIFLKQLKYKKETFFIEKGVA